jgi:hypothetical protein
MLRGFAGLSGSASDAILTKQASLDMIKKPYYTIQDVHFEGNR